MSVNDFVLKIKYVSDTLSLSSIGSLTDNDDFYIYIEWIKRRQ